MERIQYVSQGDTFEEQKKNITNVLENGVRWIQLRWKNACYDDFLVLAREVKVLCEQYKAVFIINDSVEIAKMLDADGVHLGLTDMSIKDARNILGAGKIIGGTANTYEDVVQRIEEDCDYIGLGPLRFTTNKHSLSPILGMEGYIEIIQRVNIKQQVVPPIFAIGGVVEKDILLLQEIGVYGISASGLLTYNFHCFRSLNNLFVAYVKDSE